MEGIVNYRTLAAGLNNRQGQSIRLGAIHRSGTIELASEGDIETLRRAGVNHIYDFRSQEEHARTPASITQAFTVRHYDILKAASLYQLGQLMEAHRSEIRQMMVEMYADSFAKTPLFGQVIRDIAAQDAPAFLFHCAAGKDRTGVFGAILMMMLDFDEAAIRTEHQRIDQPAMEGVKQMIFRRRNIPEDTSHFDEMFTILPEYTDAFFDAVYSAFGSTDAYLKNLLGVTEEDKKWFQQRYMAG